jgi:uncharacterized membrane protein
MEADAMAEQDGTPQDGAGESILTALKSKELLVPAALSAAGVVAAAKAPDLIHRLGDATERRGQEEAEELGEKAVQGARKGLAGGKSGAVGKALSKALPGAGGGPKKTRRLPIQRWTDVAVPIDKAYDAWTDFNQFPKFMHRVQSVRQKGEDRLAWEEKIWFSKRRWEGRITDRRKNDRIAWKTTSGMSHRGIVSFHALADNLTRVMVDIEFEPAGMVEKLASGLRFVKRAVQSDLARFKAYVEMEDAKGIEYRSGAEDGHKDDAEREEGRKGREQARKERRESANAS